LNLLIFILLLIENNGLVGNPAIVVVTVQYHMTDITNNAWGKFLYFVFGYNSEKFLLKIMLSVMLTVGHHIS